MRALLASVLLVFSAGAGAQPASPSSQGEIGYPAGALGYDALMAGDVRRAEAQLLLSPADSNDPAVLINLGQVYARKGDVKRATMLFRRVMAADSEELVLSSGAIVDSREAALRALRQISPTASR